MSPRTGADSRECVRLIAMSPPKCAPLHELLQLADASRENNRADPAL